MESWLSQGHEMAAIVFTSTDGNIGWRVFGQFLPRGACPVGVMKKSGLETFNGWSPSVRQKEVLVSLRKEMEAFYG
jgi:hypothetical protein